MSEKIEVEYDPNGLLDEARDRNQLQNDAALARLLEVAPPVISKIRHHRMSVGSTMILKLHELAGMTVPEVRAFVGGQP